MKPGVSHLWRARSISLWDGSCRVVLVGRESQFRNRKYFYVGISDKLDEGLSKEKRPVFLRLMHFAMAFCLVLIKSHHWESGRMGNGEMAQQLRALTVLARPKFSSQNPCQFTTPRNSSSGNITFCLACLCILGRTMESHTNVFFTTMTPDSRSAKLG